MKPNKLIVNKGCILVGRMNGLQLFKGQILETGKDDEVISWVLSNGCTLSKDVNSGSDFLIADFDKCPSVECSNTICDGSCEPAKESAKEPAKEPAKESAKEPAKEPAKERSRPNPKGK